jgi:hypothetical protein
MFRENGLLRWWAIARPTAPGTLGPPFRPEEELILACARTRMDPAMADRLRSLLGPTLDWAYVLSVGQRHGVLPLVHWHLKEVPAPLVPVAVRERLKLSFELTGRRNLYLSLQLRAILKRFADHGIPATPYKGPTLALMAYGRLDFREFGDLDIMVKKDDVLRAKEVLVAAGYRSASQLTEAQERALVASQHAYSLMGEDGTVTVELHWEISPRHVSVAPQAERLWERLSPMALAGAIVYTLPPDTLLPSLCEHGSKHIWERLSWICDIGELVRARPELNWPQIMSEARRTGSERTLRLGLRLASDLLGAPMPEAVRHWVETDPTIAELVNQVRARLFRDHDRRTGLLEQAQFHLLVRQRWRQRIRYCWLALTTVTVADWDRQRLPRILSFLYYPMRFIRLAAGAYTHRHR